MRPDRPSAPAFHAAFMDRRRGASFVYKRFLVPAIAESDADLMAATRHADILVSVTLALAAPIVAARRGLPWLSSAFQPAMLYSARDPPEIPGLPLHRRWPAMNRFMLQKAREATADWVAPLVAYRRAEGLGEYADHPVFWGQHSPEGVLALYSPIFGAVPDDAPPRTTQTGQVLQSGGPQAPADVLRFLDRGPAPVVFTLGSASAHAAKGFFAESVAHARRLGERALCLVGRPGNLAGLRLPADVFATPAAPYHEVFPRAKAVVHQGGIGTIALGIAAGSPMVLVPFAHDQADNSARAVRAGLARRLSPRAYRRRGAAILSAVLEESAPSGRRHTAAQQISAENGAERAAAKILEHAQTATADRI